MAAAFASLFAKPFAIPTSDMLLLGLFGIVTQGGGLGLYMMGARRLPSAQAALLTSAEMPMAPLWVWIFFNEMPANETFVGAALVAAAILWNLRMELKTQPKVAEADAAIKEAALREGV